MSHLRTALVLVAIAVLGGSAVTAQVTAAQRQNRLERTIDDQRSIICDQATALNSLTGEIRPVLARIYPQIGLPPSALPPTRPLPKECR